MGGVFRCDLVSDAYGRRSGSVLDAFRFAVAMGVVWEVSTVRGMPRCLDGTFRNIWAPCGVCLGLWSGLKGRWNSGVDRLSFPLVVLACMRSFLHALMRSARGLHASTTSEDRMHASIMHARARASLMNGFGQADAAPRSCFHAFLGLSCVPPALARASILPLPVWPAALLASSSKAFAVSECHLHGFTLTLSLRFVYV